MIKVLPIKNLLSIRLWLLSNLCVTKVTKKVTQLTAGTAIERSDLATRKLLKMLADWFKRNGIKNGKLENIFAPATTSLLDLAVYSVLGFDPISINAFVMPHTSPVNK